MSWSDDIRCLYCDGRLPLYRKITHGQFCSSVHRKAYWQEQERLAVERLHQTHNSLQAYRAPAPLDWAPGPDGPRGPEDWHDDPQIAAAPQAAAAPKTAASPKFDPKPDLNVDPGMAGIIAVASIASAGAEITSSCPSPVSADPVEYEPGTQLVAWGLAAAEAPSRLRSGNQELLLAEGVSWGVALPRNVQSSALRESLEPQSVAPSREAIQPGRSFARSLRLRTAERVEMDGAQLLGVNRGNPGRISALAASPDPLPYVPYLVLNVRAEIRPKTAVLERMLEQSAPLQERLCALHLGTARAPQPAIPVESPGAEDALAAPHVGGPVYSTLITDAPAVQLRLVQLRLASKCSHRIEDIQAVPGSGATAQTGVADFGSPAAEVVLPGARNLSPGNVANAGIPSNSRLLALAMKAAAAPPSKDSLRAKSAPDSQSQPFSVEPWLPHCRLEPLAAKPIADVFQPVIEAAAPAPLPTSLPLTDAAPRTTRSRGIHVWVPVADFWKHAPRDLKMLVIAIPALIGLVFHPALPKVRVQAPAGSGIEKAVNAQLAGFRQTVLDRAAVQLNEDFRAGLDGWISRGNATAAWSFDATGFVQPGPLALYQPSMNLSDYQVQFLGMIDKKAMSWVVRASDFENYYVVKLVVLKPGPLPLVGVTRYAVIGGKAQDRVDTAVAISARPDMLYRVRVDVHDEDFSLEIQGQMIDSWSEPRLRRGGIGFFSARGEESRVRWVQVTHQYDMLGRLCAYLAPYNIPIGSW